jgi:hypothetical protein
MIVFMMLMLMTCEATQNHTQNFESEETVVHPSRFHSVDDGIVRYMNGIVHHVDGPAIITETGRQLWLKLGIVHNDNGPAIVEADGTMCWMQNGIVHRDGGPAIVDATDEYWYRRGVLYRSRKRQLDE